MLTSPVTAVLLDRDCLSVDDDVFIPLGNLFDHWHCFNYTAADQIIPRLQGAQVAICNKTQLTKAVLNACPDLRLILVSATGVNNVDIEAANALGITVCNCQGYGVNAVTQHTMMLMLALAGRVIDYNQAVKEGEWTKSSKFYLSNFPMMELSGKTLGIIGYGELGQGVAKLAQAFGMRIMIGHLPNRPTREGAVPVDELLPNVDVLTLHCPLTEQTRNLLDEKALYSMKPKALLINAARGGIVNEQALANVLRQGHLGGAATDVLTQEPPPADNPLLATDIPRLIITPHCAWATREAQCAIVNQLIENASAFLMGHPIRVVN